MGLAQLYQLRGRVGRGANRAYAYFFFHPDKKLKETAERRLKTILSATELGAGFRIAMKDLEIRGGGGTSSASSSTATSPPWASTSTCGCSAETVEELRAGYEGKPPPPPKRRPRRPSTCQPRRTSPTTTSPTCPRGSPSTSA